MMVRVLSWSEVIHICLVALEEQANVLRMGVSLERDHSRAEALEHLLSEIQTQQDALQALPAFPTPPEPSSSFSSSHDRESLSSLTLPAHAAASSPLRPAALLFSPTGEEEGEEEEDLSLTIKRRLVSSSFCRLVCGTSTFFFSLLFSCLSSLLSLSISLPVPSLHSFCLLSVLSQLF